MWTCWKCSYAYNPVKSSSCEICKLPRPPNAREKPSKMKAGNGSNNSLEDDFQLVTVALTGRAAIDGGNFTDAGGGGEQRLGEEEEDCWVCKRCTLQNPRDSDLCLACGGARRRSSNRRATQNGHAAREPAQAAAAAEATQNGQANKEQQGQSKVEGRADRNKWACSKCTLLNKASDATCVACESPREQQEQQPAPPSSREEERPRRPSGPRCPACTFENAPVATICEMCGTVLGNKRAEEEHRRSSAR